MRYRIEKDSIGEYQIPAEAYYGIHTLRSKEAFQLTKHGLNRQMIKALAQVKKTAAKTNLELGLLDKKIAEAIILSCEEILNGRLHGQFITDIVQGGSGTSMNMNANEVIANRANEMLGGEKGKYDRVHPLNHVNLNQSSGEVVLLAGKITTIRLTKKMLMEAKKLVNAYDDKIRSYVKVKETQFSFANAFRAFSNCIERDMKRIENSVNALHEINIGASYFETNRTIDNDYIKKFVKNIALFSGEPFQQTKEIVDNSRNLDYFLWLSSNLRSLGVNLSKSASDIKILLKENKIKIPEIQESAYINDTYNPVVLDVVNQISFYIMGNDVTIARSVEAGELEKNIYLPMIYACLFESLNLLRRAMRTLREKTIEDLVLSEDIS